MTTGKVNDNFVIPEQIITDCVSRFFMAEGDKILQDRIHFCTYLEQSYWFYIDMWVEEDPVSLKEVSFLCFVERVCEVTELPIPGGGTPGQLCADFNNFKQKVNTYGGILINEELNKVLLVQSFNGHSWGFPKGKIEKKESFPECAIREVKEEINYDMTPYINPDCFLESSILEQKARLYIIYGVPETTPFKTNTRKEIGNIRWFDINSLPVHRKDKKSLIGLGYTPNNFFVVIPLVKELREHVNIVQKNCWLLFNYPFFKQDKHYYKYLKAYYPHIYKIRMAHQKKVNEKKPSNSQSITLKEPNILDMLQVAMNRGQSQSPSTSSHRGSAFSTQPGGVTVLRRQPSSDLPRPLLEIMTPPPLMGVRTSPLPTHVGMLPRFQIRKSRVWAGACLNFETAMRGVL